MKNQKDISIILEFLSPKDIPKGKYFLKQGQWSDEIAFIEKGAFQLTYTNKGKQWTKGFSFESDWLGSLRSLVSKQANLYSIIALEDSKILSVSYSNLVNSVDSSYLNTELLLPFVIDLYLKKEEREFDFLSLSAEERYKKFLDQYGSNSKRLKQNHIASYLGITNVALSRIHSRIFNLG
jgi:CRP-like cAMP-binding protein